MSILFPRWPGLSLPMLCAVLCAWWTGILSAQESVVLSGPAELVPAGRGVPIRLLVFNEASKTLTFTFPPRMDGRIRAGTETLLVTMPLRATNQSLVVDLSPGSFVARDYLLTIPEGWRGEALLDVQGWSVNSIVLHIGAADAIAAPQPESRVRMGATPANPASHEPKRPWVNAERFFKDHLFGYEPFYFIAGTESPNAKFQISFRYQILNASGWLAEKAPPLLGFNVGYTQTSLWDWNAASSPFFDSSYKPEFLYLWTNVFHRRWTNWMHLDLQGGLQHESNGRDDLESRSLNIAYVRPSVTLGNPEEFFVTLTPRVWTYVGDLDDNPDLEDYRGYADLRAIVGWARGPQLAATGRLGDDGNRSSLQLDLTFPLMSTLYRNFSMYVHAQYFTGYGESLLLYRERSSAFRFGFSLYR